MKIPPQIAQLLQVLEEDGFPSFIVGGCVRDTVMGIPPHDYDICTAALPEQIRACFLRRGYKTVDTGIQHGTVSVILPTEAVEVTTFRADGGYSDGRHPDSVAFITDIEADLSRRDFTINAIAYSPSGGLIDPFQGVAELQSPSPHIRCVGDAVQRLREDALRILRALRFSATLCFPIDAATRDALFAEADRLLLVSPERIRDELTKLVCGKDADKVLREYAAVLARILPEITPSIGFLQHNPYHCYDVWEHTLAAIRNAPAEPAVRLAMLFHDLGKPHCFTMDDKGIGHFNGHMKISTEIARAVMERLHFPNELKERVATLVYRHDVPIEETLPAIRRWLGRLGEEALRQLLAVKEADALAKAAEVLPRVEGIGRLRALLDEILAADDCYTLRSLAIGGDDLLALGLSGREIGETLKRLLDAVIEQPELNTREQLLRLVIAGTENN